MKNHNIAIIGFGRFGQLLTKILVEHSSAQVVVISSKKSLLVEKEARNLAWGTFADVKRADVVIPCVPIRFFEDTVRRVAPLCKSGAIVLDVCSVKIFPVEIMKKYLPSTVDIIATHPLFGPDSYRNNSNQPAGLKMVINQTRCSNQKFAAIKQLFQKMELDVIEMSPQKHDQYAAHSMSYFSLIGKIGNQLGMTSTPIDTPWFEKLLQLQEVVANDSDQLFWDMQRYNPFTKKLRNQIIEELLEINSKFDNQ